MEEVESEAKLFSSEWFGIDYYELYKVIETETGQAILRENVLMMQRFYVGPTKVNHKRTVYGILDFLGDIGGLLDGLKLIATSLIWLITSDGV